MDLRELRALCRIRLGRCRSHLPKLLSGVSSGHLHWGQADRLGRIARLPYAAIAWYKSDAAYSSPASNCSWHWTQ